jgi:ketosteroid isomerase-like protein
MSWHKDVLHKIAEAISSGGAFHIAEWFTEDVRLYEPTKPDWPTRHAGASKLLDGFKALTPPIRFEILDTVEQGDRIAVRWALSATYRDEPLHLAMIAIYCFEDGRIAEDWGIPIRGEWP